MTCDHCHTEQPTAHSRVDPFASEVYGDDTPRVLCDECWNVRKDDV